MDREVTGACVACNERPGVIETLIGKVCDECENGPAAAPERGRDQLDEYRGPAGQAQILHGPLDL